MISYTISYTEIHRWC